MPTYTVRQQQVLEFVRTTLEERGIAPTLEEIATDLGGISRVSVLDHLRALERKGAIRRRQREARAIEILDPQYVPTRGVPLVGTIAAGSPILEASVREDVDLEEFLGVGNGSFLLRVRGESMIEDHICDGDLVLVESRTSARDGETVVAVVKEEVTLKRLQRDRDRIRLEPANGSMLPMVFPADEVQIRGVVRGVIRRT
ncbi:MAG TPA: transcriptional repressor LexA [Planctomycetota bacterium]|nr:transcriptional repressor LexA [Planctomycetota bacterium]